MRCGSSRMSLLLEEKRVLQLELQALENRQKGEYQRLTVYQINKYMQYMAWYYDKQLSC